jgi:hypothetical protein
LLRELGRLQDEQRGLTAKAGELHERWRDAVRDTEADERAERIRERAARLRRRLEAVNDARLSREGRNAYEDAREALESLEAMHAADATSAGDSGGPPDPAEAGERAGRASALMPFERADQAAQALDRARAGTPDDEPESAKLADLSRDVAKLRERLQRPLPTPGDALDDVTQRSAAEDAGRQSGLGDRTRAVLDTELGAPLPDPGRQALEAATDAMREARQRFDDVDGRLALRRAREAGAHIQRAIDSLRNREPPPSAASAEEDASTEAERDRTLRDQVVEAMREGDEIDGATKRYYEELLK